MNEAEVADDGDEILYDNDYDDDIYNKAAIEGKNWKKQSWQSLSMFYVVK